MLPSTRLRVHYGWIVAAVVFLALLAAAGMRSTPSILLVPLEHEFGWSPATVSLAVSINLVFYGLSGPFVAAVMDRFGIQRVMMSALFIIACSAGLTIFMHQPWQLDVLWGLLVGLSTGAITSVLGTMVANRWFVKRRGLVLGLFSASNAAGQLVFLPALAALAVTYGWRSAALATAGAALVVVPLVAIFFRERPQDVGLFPYGADSLDEGAATNNVDNPFATAIRGLGRGLRTPDFWLLAGSFFICGATTNGLIGTHLIPASMDHGISEVTAAGMLALIGIFDLFGTTISGWLSDRMDNRWLLCWYYGLRGCSLLLLPYALSSSYLSLAVFIVFYGLDWVATVPPTARLTTELFGVRNAGVIYGWIFASHQLGAATAAFFAGLLRTWLGSYQISFISAGLLCLCASGMVIRIGRQPRPRQLLIDDIPTAMDAPLAESL